jgi:hypothetical protein
MCHCTATDLRVFWLKQYNTEVNEGRGHLRLFANKMFITKRHNSINRILYVYGKREPDPRYVILMHHLFKHTACTLETQWCNNVQSSRKSKSCVVFCTSATVISCVYNGGREVETKEVLVCFKDVVMTARGEEEGCRSFTKS